MKKIQEYKNVFIFIILISIFTLLVYMTQSTNLSPSKKEKNLYYNTRETETMETLIYYDNYSAIAVHYPLLNNQNLNQKINSIIKDHLQEFNLLIKNSMLNNSMYKGELNIDYDIYYPMEEIVSLQFNIVKNLPYYANPNIQIHTINYDLSNNKELELKDIMKGKYLETVSTVSKDYFKDREKYQNYTSTNSFQQGLAPIKDNYSHFLLHDNYINFLFPKYTIFPSYLGISESKIPYEQLSEYIKPKFLEIASKETFSANNYEEIDEIEIIENRKIDPDLPMIALTFDDGPNPQTTIPILNTLREYESVATFFVLGNRVINNGDIIRRIVGEGSEIGNHSFNHKQLTTISSQEIKDQINQTQNAVVEVAGIEPQIMRPTYGSYDENLQSQVNMPIVLWSIDTEDWKRKNPDKIVNHVLDNVKDGDIILMHDIYTSTSKAVEDLVPALINRGFQLVTVSELYEIQGEVLEVGNIYGGI